MASFDGFGGGGDGGGSIDFEKILGQVKAIQKIFGGRQSGAGNAPQKAMAEIMRAMLKFEKQQALIARKQWEFQLSAMYPGGPGAEVPVEFWNLPTKLTTKQTKIAQARMKHPNRLVLQQKQKHIEAKIAKYKANHPEAMTLRLARSS